MKKIDILIVTAAFLSFVFSVSLWFSGARDEGLFVGVFAAMGCLVFFIVTVTEIRRLGCEADECAGEAVT